jgi:undecaprenyl-diphosphatase
MKKWNLELFYKIYKNRSKTFSTISWLISNQLFLFLFFGFLTIVFLSLKHNWYLVWKLSFNILIILLLVKIVIDLIIKRFSYHPRPYITQTDIDPLGKKEQNSTSPSGHTTAVTAAVLTLCFYNPWFILLLPFVPLIMWSRVYNGMHWPLDVFLGLILGLVFANFSFIITNLIFK